MRGRVIERDAKGETLEGFDRGDVDERRDRLHGGGSILSRGVLSLAFPAPQKLFGVERDPFLDEPFIDESPAPGSASLVESSPVSITRRSPARRRSRGRRVVNPRGA